MALHATSGAAGLLRLALVLALGLAPAVAHAARVVDVRIALHPEFTRVVFETDVPTRYWIEREGEVVLVRFSAGSTPQRIRWPGPRLSAVALEARPDGSVARIFARDEVSIEELVLENPPRIVLDLRVREAEATPTDVGSAPAQAPAPIDGGSTEPAEPAETEEPAELSAPTAPIPPDETRPLEVTAPAEPGLAEAAKSADQGAEPVEAGAAETGAPADTEPAPAEVAAEKSEPVVAPEPPRPQPAVPMPPPTVKPQRSERPPVASPPPRKGRSRLLLVGALAALAAVGALAFAITFRLLRHRPEENDRVRMAELVEIDESAPGAPAPAGREPSMAEAEPEAFEPESGVAEAEPGAIEVEAPLERAEPAPAQGAPEIDQMPPERQEGAPMSQEPELPKAQRPDVPVPRPPEPGATAPAEDALRLIQSLERRVFQLEGRLDEAVDAKRLLERQLASQAEELRVQRATLARMQRVLRNLSAPESSSRSYPVHH